MSRFTERQQVRDSHAMANLDASTQPPAPTVKVVAEHVALAGARRFIQLETPRSRDPRTMQVRLLSRSGPLSAEGEPVKWDGSRRAVTACWHVEDLRAWVESNAPRQGSASMQIINTEIKQTDIMTLIASVYECEPGDVDLALVDGEVVAVIKAGLAGVNKVERLLKKASGE